MPKSTPIGDYPSKSAAVIAMFFDQNRPIREIAQFVMQSESAVTAVIANERARRRRKDMLPWQREKALRILPPIFDVVAEALGCTSTALIEMIKHTTFPTVALRPHGAAAVIDPSPHVDDEPSPADDTTSIDPAGEGQFRSGASTPDASAAGGELRPEASAPSAISNPEPEASVIKMKPATQATWDEKITVGLVTLRDPTSGRYLNLDGSGYTDDRRYIYRGTPAQARTMRDRNPVAKGMSFRTFTSPKP